jgi:hypothetical protein
MFYLKIRGFRWLRDTCALFTEVNSITFPRAEPPLRRKPGGRYDPVVSCEIHFFTFSYRTVYGINNS